MGMIRLDAPVTEPVPVQEVFATGSDFEIFEDFVRIRFWSEQTVCGSTERIVVCKIVIPRRLWDALSQNRRDFMMPLNG